MIVRKSKLLEAYKESVCMQNLVLKLRLQFLENRKENKTMFKLNSIAKNNHSSLHTIRLIAVFMTDRNQICPFRYLFSVQDRE
ncbi:hypothetical protein BpHYR1_039391 [Brachionus plicatilis]|uniref:Uncharacterized protein n=1 Tax=Brachionus plicatilis TaxID=10195 RepID=A0A3M7SUA9_BRAPC|nr:hypothetical protein BpHYR1_039391 [Brachionus plicatilis]